MRPRPLPFSFFLDAWLTATGLMIVYWGGVTHAALDHVRGEADDGR